MARTTYTIQELALRSGVSVRTLRNWIRLGVLSPPLGRSRATYYDQRHLARAQLAKKLRQARHSVTAIRTQLAASDAAAAGVESAKLATGTAQVAAAASAATAPAGTTWRIITLRQGLVLMVQTDGDEGVRGVAERIYAAFGRE